jgi:hypothetical protein
MHEHAAALEQELDTARLTRDREAVHGARIAVKRLRYLLEPIADERSQATALVERLKRLQNVLGELHDLQVLQADLGVAVAEAAAERARHLHAAAVAGTAGHGRGKRAGAGAGPRPASAGLLALARFAGRRQDELFRHLEAEWASGPLTTLTADLRAFADDLAAAATPPPRLPPPRRAQPRRARTRPA